MEKDKLYDMHYGATADIFQTAVILRNNMTKSEKVLWEQLKYKKLNGIKFRRQHPIDRYIVDFYSHKYKLVIELDGEIHLKKEVVKKDIEREKELVNFGLKVIRFKNEEVLNNIDNVLSEIVKIIGTIDIT